MLYLTCTTKTSVDLAHYGVSRAKDWVSVDCGTRGFNLSLFYSDRSSTFSKNVFGKPAVIYTYT